MHQGPSSLRLSSIIETVLSCLALVLFSSYQVAGYGK
ncbi:hypothetical protein HID58_076750 [Brassica napus]|uniref:Uncharacterized protein n=1 Tax=Brassica napus TaxID=3708 RepID=A0ABQ7YQZ3_BRANA|nr:hypothetical protein HID58_076750 [Brassica napus]